MNNSVLSITQLLDIQLESIATAISTFRLNSDTKFSDIILTSFHAVDKGQVEAA